MPKIIPDLTANPATWKYDWETWLDGQAREFIQGEDFDCSMAGFVSSANQAAKRRGVRVTTRRPREGTVELQALKPEE